MPVMTNKPRSKSPGKILPNAPAKTISGSVAEPTRPAEVDVDDSSAGIRVLCADDHQVLVEGLKAQFAIEGKIRVIGWLPSTDRLLDETVRLKPDVILLDIEIPGPDAFETADRLRHMVPQVRIVFLSAHVRDGYIAAAYKCGACGYFAKGDDLKAIEAGIREVARSSSAGRAASDFVMGPKVQERCLVAHATSSAAHPGVKDPAGGSPSTPLEDLSEREIEVLRLIGKGMSRTEIAKELSRSAKTIDGHQDRMMKKLGIQTRAELMRFAIREGFAEA